MEPKTVVSLSPVERDYVRNYVAALLRSENFSRLIRETEKPIYESSVAQNARHKLMQLGVIKMPGLDSKLPEKFFPLVPGPSFATIMQEESKRPHSTILADLRVEERQTVTQLSTQDILIKVAERILILAFGTKTSILASRLAEKSGTSEDNILKFTADRRESFRQNGQLICLPNHEVNFERATLPPPLVKPRKSSTPFIERAILEKACELIAQQLRQGGAHVKTGINHVVYKQLQRANPWLPPFQDLKAVFSKTNASAAFGIKVGTNYKVQSVLLLANSE